MLMFRICLFAYELIGWLSEFNSYKKNDCSINYCVFSRLLLQETIFERLYIRLSSFIIIPCCYRSYSFIPITLAVLKRIRSNLQYFSISRSFFFNFSAFYVVEMECSYVLCISTVYYKHGNEIFHLFNKCWSGTNVYKSPLQ